MNRVQLTAFVTENVWPRRGAAAWCLLPLSLVYRAVIAVRRALYDLGVFKIHKVAAPVIVVGNLTTGGSGKTPLVIRIVEYLQQQGWRPGVVSRGYGAGARHWPQFVDEYSDPFYAGDEPVLIARRTGCPVMVDPDRANAVESLLASGVCDVVISDDGLQHYRMGRDVEIVVVDGERRIGNGWCLPAGPLREPWRRQRQADFVVCNGGRPGPGEFAMQLRAQSAVNLLDPALRRPLAEFGGVAVHALAGIGDPQRFFALLRASGLSIEAHPYPDHYPYAARDLIGLKDDPVIMTEKDAIKCHRFATGNMWYVPVVTEIDNEFLMQLVERLSDDNRQEAA